MLRTEPINATIQRTKALPPPEPLFYSLWNEGEVACLFADSNVGKSILALQIAETIAEKRPVVYYDFEMEDRQLTDRYSVEETSHVFPDNLYRTSIIWSDETDKSFEDALIRDIELNTLKHGANVLIIDNLTFMCLDSEKGDAAGRLMIKLIRLKRKYGWSILVISHTPKRDEKAPIEPRHLAGSKRIFNFADSVFAMGKSSQDKHFRYIIQLKDRLGEKEYDQDNVIVMELEKAEDGNLHYIFKGTDSERNQLYAYDGGPDIATIKEVLRMKAEGHSFREIASAIDGVSKSTAQRIWKKYHDTIEQEPDTDVLALVS